MKRHIGFIGLAPLVSPGLYGKKYVASMRSQSNAAEHAPAEPGVHCLKIAAVHSGVLLALYVKFGDTLSVVQKATVLGSNCAKVLEQMLLMISMHMQPRAPRKKNRFNTPHIPAHGHGRRRAVGVFWS